MRILKYWEPAFAVLIILAVLFTDYPLWVKLVVIPGELFILSRIVKRRRK